MGHRKKHAPRRGSLGVRPRKRAARILPRIKAFPSVALPSVTPLAFLGYKVGCTHAFVVDSVPSSPTYGKEIFTAVTFLETPPMLVGGIRLYGNDPSRGKYILGEVWASKDTLDRFNVSRLIKNFDPPTLEEAGDEIRSMLDRAVEVRALLLSVPNNAGGPSQKKPFLLETALSDAPVSSKFSFLESRLGTLLRVSEVIKTGMFLDVLGVTKGKGFQGVIKRFGVKELPKWHKHRKGSRKVGARGSTVGALSTTPQAGQTGFHRRTEFNKLVLMVGSAEEARRFNPKGGWKNYGLIESDFVVVKGSVMGAKKRPLLLRYPIRPPRGFSITSPVPVRLVYIKL